MYKPYVLSISQQLKSPREVPIMYCIYVSEYQSLKNIMKRLDTPRGTPHTVVILFCCDVIQPYHITIFLQKIRSSPDVTVNARTSERTRCRTGLGRSRDSFRSIAALDRTGDGRLHFFEFLGAMIGAGRIQYLGNERKVPW